jgi:DNA-binding MarR family transcriptional regulator
MEVVNALETDLEKLEAAMRLFFQTMKRPQYWSQVTALAGVNIDRPAALVLHALTSTRTSGWRVQDLAAHLGIEAPSITRKTQELELAGYVRRTRDPKDKRVIGLQLTPRGLTLNARIRKAQSQTIAQTLSLWPANERKQFIAFFEQFSNDLANLYVINKPIK